MEENTNIDIIKNTNISVTQTMTNQIMELRNFIQHLWLAPITLLILIFIFFIILLIIIFIYFQNNTFVENFDFLPVIKESERNAERNVERNIERNKYYDPSMNYYVCSYGGCGSYMLCDYLRIFGNVEHIHSRKPPNELEYVGANNTENPVYGEWFNGVKIPERELANYKVIYLYRDPVKAIYSRFQNPEHLQHIECDPTITLKNVVESKKDLYHLKEFFTNYTSKKKSKKRNYTIYCVNYDDFWKNIQEFNRAAGIPDVPALYPIRKETVRENNEEETKILYEIYSSLLEKMMQTN
jgi:hypothetical protein